MEKKLEIYGARSIIEAINANQNIDKVLLLKSSKSSLTKSLVNLIIKKNISKKKISHIFPYFGPPPPSGTTHVIFCDGSLISHVLQ